MIPRHCKHFHSPIFSNRFIFPVSPLSRAAKPHGARNKIYVLKRHFITLISYYKLPISHFPLWSYKILVKISEKFVELMILYRFFLKFCELYSLLGRGRQSMGSISSNKGEFYYSGHLLQVSEKLLWTLILCRFFSWFYTCWGQGQITPIG